MAGEAAHERDDGDESLFSSASGLLQWVMDAMSTAWLLTTGKLSCVPKTAHKLPNGRGTMVLSLGGVVDFEGDAIVIAANEGCLGQ